MKRNRVKESEKLEMEAMNVTTRVREEVRLEDDSTETELHKIRLLRAMVEARDPSAKVNNILSFYTKFYYKFNFHLFFTVLTNHLTPFLIFPFHHLS